MALAFCDDLALVRAVGAPKPRRGLRARIDIGSCVPELFDTGGVGHKFPGLPSGARRRCPSQGLGVPDFSRGGLG